MMFLLLPILFLLYSFVNFCCHLTFRILRLHLISNAISLFVFFLQRPCFTCVQYYADYAGYHNVLVFMIMLLLFQMFLNSDISPVALPILLPFSLRQSLS